MRYILVFAIALFAPIHKASAQFYTLGKGQTEVNAPYRTTEKAKNNNDTIDEVNKILMTADSLSRLWKSVSPPLEELTVNSSYGRRKDPITGKVATHSGIDLRAAMGDTVRSMMDGTVIATGRNERSGIYVTLMCGSYAVSYCHLSKVLVSNGETVKAGQIVAVSGNTGRSTGAHLHITVKNGGKTIDPKRLIDSIIAVRKNSALEIIKLAESINQ